jgi:hypothetical protein
MKRPKSYTIMPGLRAPAFFSALLGVFQLRPVAIYFDLFFQWEQGRWKLFGIDVQPAPMGSTLPPGGQSAPPEAQSPVPQR